MESCRMGSPRCCFPQIKGQSDTGWGGGEPTSKAVKLRHPPDPHKRPRGHATVGGVEGPRGEPPRTPAAIGGMEGKGGERLEGGCSREEWGNETEGMERGRMGSGKTRG